MAGHKSGVGANLLQMYPDIILWHCANHRLELSIADAVDEVSGINSFKIILDSLHSRFYSQFCKNQEELEACAKDLGVVLKKLGRVVDTRWTAFYLRVAKAVWVSYPALAEHFSSPHMKNKAKFEGLLSTLQSTTFLRNLAIMLDALTEVSNLSLALQNRSTGIIESHHLIKQTIKSMEALSETPGEYLQKAEEAIEAGCFAQTVQLT